jgi:hypothetical protein
MVPMTQRWLSVASALFISSLAFFVILPALLIGLLWSFDAIGWEPDLWTVLALGGFIVLLVTLCLAKYFYNWLRTRTDALGPVFGYVALAGGVLANFALLIAFAYLPLGWVGAPPPLSVPPDGVPPPAQYDKRGGSERLDAIDRILETLDLGNVAFNAPKTMHIGDTAVIQLMLGLETPIDELKSMIESLGDKEGAQIRVADRMEARLSGPNFAITAITPEIQVVSRRNITEWKWEIEPKADGYHHLHLTLSALLSVYGVSTPRAIRTFDEVIEVKVEWHQQVGSFFEKNWQWLWAAVLVPVIGWLWKRRKQHKPDASQID